ncbi:MAG: hypothetical protein A2X46_05390 [Lentisphaerae bacterium GWF2_57_35]|nr:MAG: hypothetical protein A2X46_05390 [Lentisphaerae bacterium GWF2_57_35]
MGWMMLVGWLGVGLTASAQGLAKISKTPYLGAIVVDAASGKALFEDHADTKGYPASVLKLMDLLIILEKIDQGVLKLEDPVTVTAESSRIGGSQVYLKEHEVFTVDELLYALMIQSANDAATALAIHIAGTKDAFVELMNQKAKELGMTATTFESVHGLPPGKGQKPDITTARDLAILGCALAKHPQVFKYTSVRQKGFRNDTFGMQTHNHLLGSFEGCDGFKTGYYKVAGFSIVATAVRNGNRVIAVVMGSEARDVRDAKAKELLTKGFMALPRADAAKPAGK